MNIEDHIQNFFSEYEIQANSSNYSLMIFDNHGLIQYSKNIGNDHHDLSVLMLGLASAGREVLERIFSVNKDEEALSLGTSKRGIFLYPLNEFNLYLACLYNGLSNPGQLKHECRLCRDELKKFLDNSNTFTEDENQDGFLFTKISDREIDSLFGNIGV